MSSKRSKTNYPGVYSREHDSRRHRGKPDICYDICYRLPGDRKLIWEKVGWASEKFSAAIAANVRAERIKQARIGKLPTEAAKLSLDQVFERFRTDYLEVSRKRPKDAVCIYRHRISPLLGDLPLGQISPVEVDRLKKSLAHLSAQSVKHTLTLLGQIFRQAQRWGLYEGEIPTTHVKTPQADNRRLRFLTRDEAGRLLEALAARSTDLWRMALLSLYTGMRAGEIFQLRWEHVNFTEGTLAIMDGKGEQSRVAHMTRQVREMLEALPDKKRGHLVFPQLGTNTRRVSVSALFRTVTNSLGLNDGIPDRRDWIVFHSLRHTFASWLVQAGVPLYTVQRLMGHKTIAMTQRYAHLAPEQGQEAARLLSGMELGAGA